MLEIREKILSLYDNGMKIGDIKSHIQDIYEVFVEEQRQYYSLEYRVFYYIIHSEYVTLFLVRYYASGCFYSLLFHASL